MTRLSVVIFALLCVTVSEAKIFTRFKAIKCYVYDPSGVSFHYCNVKPYSRKTAVLNVGINFLKPINDQFYAQTIVSYRYGTIFRTAIKGNIIEWCDVVERLESDVIVKFLGALIKESVPQLYHACPYVGRHDLQNITVNDKNWPSMFPQGLYKGEINATHEKIPLFKVAFSVELTTDLKTSF